MGSQWILPTSLKFILKNSNTFLLIVDLQLHFLSHLPELRDYALLPWIRYSVIFLNCYNETI